MKKLNASARVTELLNEAAKKTVKMKKDFDAECKEFLNALDALKNAGLGFEYTVEHQGVPFKGSECLEEMLVKTNVKIANPALWNFSVDNEKTYKISLYPDFICYSLSFKAQYTNMVSYRGLNEIMSEMTQAALEQKPTNTLTSLSGAPSFAKGELSFDNRLTSLAGAPKITLPVIKGK